jgi:hypothetical protein
MGFEEFTDAVARTHSTHEKSVAVFLENSIMLPDEASDEAKKAELQSESYRLINQFLDLALQYCEDEGLEPGSDEALAAFEEAHTTATSITSSYHVLFLSGVERKGLSPDQVAEKYALLVPSHVTNLSSHVKVGGKLGVSQDDLSEVVGEYVKGRFKSPMIDRVLAQALTHVEIVAYIDEMLWKSPLTGRSQLEEAQPPSVVVPVWNFSKLVLVLWLVCLGIAASPLVFSAWPVNAMLFTGLGLGALGTIALIVLLVLFIIEILRERPRKRRLQTSIVDMIQQMNQFFLEFKSAGPFSTAHFRKRANDLAELGVVWPSGLFVLLDDMEVRGVRTF